MTPEPDDYLLVGGGLQNTLIALALVAERPTARFTLVERGPRLGGNHLWCFHAGDLSERARRFVDPLVVYRWSQYEVRFPERERVVPEPYAGITSERLHEAAMATLQAHPRARVLLDTAVTEVEAHSVRLASGEQLRGRVVMDARGPEALGASGRSGYQKFVGLEVLAPAHGRQWPVLMDARVPQVDGFRFFYVLPLDRDRVLLEDTYFSDDPSLDRVGLRAGILEYAARAGLRVTAVEREEHGVLPLPLRAGSRPASSSPIRGGYAGGWFHPTTGYSLPLAVRLAEHVAGHDPDATFGADWQVLVREQQRQFRFCAFLNDLLFSYWRPEQRWQVLQRFYALPVASIRRFYAMELSYGDRARLLCGRPPGGMSLRRVRPEPSLTPERSGVPSTTRGPSHSSPGVNP